MYEYNDHLSAGPGGSKSREKEKKLFFMSAFSFKEEGQGKLTAHP